MLVLSSLLIGNGSYVTNGKSNDVSVIEMRSFQDGENDSSREESDRHRGKPDTK